MYVLTRHSTQRFRIWLIALTAILLLVSILEAGHAHGIFSAEEDHCALCQFTPTLDKVLPSSMVFILPLFLGVLVWASDIRFTPQPSRHFASIRAPPQQLQHP